MFKIYLVIIGLIDIAMGLTSWHQGDVVLAVIMAVASAQAVYFACKIRTI